MKNKKIVSSKIVSKKVQVVETKKVEVVKQKSISRIVFKFIEDEKLLESNNRKAKYVELEALVKKDFPNSAFKKTHFFWYISRAKKQLEAGIGLEHLKTIKEVETIVEPKKVEKKKVFLCK